MSSFDSLLCCFWIISLRGPETFSSSPVLNALKLAFGSFYFDGDRPSAKALFSSPTVQWMHTFTVALAERLCGMLSWYHFYTLSSFTLLKQLDHHSASTLMAPKPPIFTLVYPPSTGAATSTAHVVTWVTLSMALIQISVQHKVSAFMEMPPIIGSCYSKMAAPTFRLETLHVDKSVPRTSMVSSSA